MADRDHFNLLRWFECLARREHKLAHVENIYGDEILMLGCRSIWKCQHCGKHFHKPNLATISEPRTCGVPPSASKTEAAGGAEQTNTERKE